MPKPLKKTGRSRARRSPRAALSGLSLELQKRDKAVKSKSKSEELLISASESVIVTVDLDPLVTAQGVSLIVDPSFPFTPRVTLTHRFRIVDHVGHTIFYAGEKRDSCSRFCCGRDRGYQFYLFATKGEVVMVVSRTGPLEYCLCQHSFEDDEYSREAPLSPSEVLNLEITLVSHVGTDLTVGRLVNRSSALRPIYLILGDDDQFLVSIRGPRFGTAVSCVNDTFILFDRKQNPIGEIVRWGDIQDINGKGIDVDVSATFPGELPSHMKSLILAAMFEMRVAYFDRVVSASEVFGLVIVCLLLAATMVYLSFVIKYFA